MDSWTANSSSTSMQAESEKDLRWQIAIECAGQGVWEIDGVFDQIYHSPTWFKMRGLSPDDPATTTVESWMSRVHPEDRAVLQKNLAAELNGDTDVVHHEYRERHEDGRWIWILSQGRIISRDANGKSLRTIGTDTDVTELKLTQERLAKLADSEHRWRIAVESAGQGLWDINSTTDQNYFSDAWRAIRGLKPDEPEPSTTEDRFESIHPEDKERLKQEFAAREIETSDAVNHEYRQRSKNGEWVWIMSRGKIVERDATGKTVRMIGTDTDITVLKKSESDLKRLSHRYELAVSTAKVGVWEFDLENCRPYWDDNTREIFGVSVPNELLPDNIWELRIHPEDRARALAISETAVKTCGNYAMDYRIVLLSGEIRHVRCRAIYHNDHSNGPRLIGVNWDVTEDYHRAEELQRAKELAEKRSMEIESAQLSLEHNALHDALTGLPNRRHLDNALNAIDGTQKPLEGRRIALMHVDLDRFKQINDTMGHMAGDAILQRVSTILKSNVGEEAIVSRSGGDEFVIVMSAAPNDGALAEMATRLLRELNEPVIYEGHECLFGASIGIAVQEYAAVSGRSLLVNADIALYRAKSEGRNRFCFFTADMQQQTIDAKKCADDIKRGLDRGEFFAVYQLQFDARSHDVIGVEALARWRHPVRGVLTPDAFLQAAEEINVVSRIDELVLEQALVDLASWRQAGISIPNVSVNISARRLGDAKLIEGLRKLDIPDQSLSFELLESIYLDNQSETVASNLEEIRKLGIGVEIDDFGTGHASIACLLSLRPKRLKIDRQLVMPIVASIETRRLLASIVDIGQALGIEVLAEGVETMEHARILADLDCSCLQGFAFARPMEAHDLSRFVADTRWRTAA
jgi:diguanylate cyclase (GGDEF)-like protein/PAS domain S-box-containing protein